MLKLTFPKIIKLNVTNKIIILDTDLILAADIAELWKLFENFNYYQVHMNISNYAEIISIFGINPFDLHKESYKVYKFNECFLFRQLV